MCQGVIGVMVRDTNAIHWGTGSHTALIKKLWPNSATDAGDKLIRFESQMHAGPGKFTIEGGECDDDQKEIIKNALLARCPDIEGVLKHVEAVQSFDTAIAEGLLTGTAWSEYCTFYNSNVMYNLRRGAEFDREGQRYNLVRNATSEMDANYNANIKAISAYYAKKLAEYVGSASIAANASAIMDRAVQYGKERDAAIEQAKNIYNAERVLINIPGTKTPFSTSIEDQLNKAEAKAADNVKQFIATNVAKIRELAAKYPQYVRQSWVKKSPVNVAAPATATATKSTLKRDASGRFA